MLCTNYWTSNWSFGGVCDTFEIFVFCICCSAALNWKRKVRTRRVKKVRFSCCVSVIEDGRFLFSFFFFHFNFPPTTTYFINYNKKIETSERCVYLNVLLSIYILYINRRSTKKLYIIVAATVWLLTAQKSHTLITSVANYKQRLNNSKNAFYVWLHFFLFYFAQVHFANLSPNDSPMSESAALNGKIANENGKLWSLIGLRWRQRRRHLISLIFHAFIFVFIVGTMLKISPAETITFQKTGNELLGTVDITNVVEYPITYKVNKQ